MGLVLLYIGLGSATGGILRYLAGQMLQHIHLFNLAIGTLVVNIVGCFLIGLFYTFVEKAGFMSNELRLFLIVGFCGSFTTFSTFINEGYMLTQSSHSLQALGYCLTSIVVGYIALYLGIHLLKWL